jgi:hypothetical protein
MVHRLYHAAFSAEDPFGIKENLRCMALKICYTKYTTGQTRKEEEP